MRITINGKAHEVPEELTLSRLAKHVGLEPAAAIRVNGKLIPRSSHADTVIREGDILDIVLLPSGG